LVRVVVRDAEGHVVPNLKKEDFQLFDNRKLQTISSFAVETPESHRVQPATSADASINATAESSSATAAPVLPQRFVALMFDDSGMVMDDSIVVRSAATRLLRSLSASDRVGIFTTSGQASQDFTDNSESLEKALLGIIPRPLSTAQGFHDCPDV